MSRNVRGAVMSVSWILLSVEIKEENMSKKRGLGKSLDALLVGSLPVEEYGDVMAKSKESITALSVDLIQRGKYQPRQDLNPQSLEELANSIRMQGVIQPIIVRKISHHKYEIIAGERRWRAAQMAGLLEIPVIIRDIPDEAAVAIALIENIQRENLNAIEEALALQRLSEEFALTHAQVAEAVGKSRASVTNLLRLLSLSDEVKTMLAHGDLEMGHARALLALTQDLQVIAAQNIVEKGLSVRQTEELVKNLQLPAFPIIPKSIDPDVRRLQEDLSKRLRLAVSIKHTSKGRGRVIISYKNLTELDNLLLLFE